MTIRDARNRGCLWFLALLGIAFLAAFGWFLRPRPAAAITDWQPSWATLGTDWQPVGAPCWTVGGAQLNGACQSGGLVSNKTWSKDFAIDARATVSATAISGGRYFAGLAVYDAQSNDTVYGELALAGGVPPMQGVPGDNAGTLVDEYFTWYQPASASRSYTLDVVWQPSGSWIFSVNGQQVSVQPGDLAHDPSIFLVCASVGEATPDDGSAAACHFSQLSVTGVESGDVRRLWLPSVGVQGYP